MSEADLHMHQYDNNDALIVALVEWITAPVTEEAATGGPVVAALAGGSTPRGLYATLALKPFPWERFTFLLTDERWVGHDSPNSNERFLRDTLLRAEASKARFLSLKTEHDTPEEAVPLLTQRLGELPPIWDMVLLGMGLDGHIASMFPGGHQLELALSPTAPPVLAMRAPGTGHPRITLSLPRLLACRNLGLYISGEDKMAVFERAREPGSVADMPVRALLRQSHVPLNVFWAP